MVAAEKTSDQAYLKLLAEMREIRRSEGHVLATLDAVISTLQRIVHQTTDTRETARIHRAMGRGTRFLEMNTNRLFGLPHTRRPTRIMVTLPSEAAEDPGFVPEVWCPGSGRNLTNAQCPIPSSS